MTAVEEAEVLVEVDGPVRIVTLNRPDRMNAVSSSLHRRLTSIWADLRDDGATAIVVTGAGESFCAGAELDWLSGFATDEALRRRSLTEAREIVEAMVMCPLPIIAAVNGPAIGFGFSLAVLADFLFIADHTFLADPHVPLGLVAADGAAVVLPSKVGLTKAKELLFFGERVPAAEAVAIGLAYRSVPGPELVATAVGFAHRVAALPPRAVQDTKRALHLPLATSMRSILDFGLAAQSETFLSAEHQAALGRLRAPTSRSRD